ncbi:nuclear protein [Macropodid alphaherpesvirus 1]|uniref:Nuclear protein n=1 Tax=Macropodid alphaherpesvirus 1 TaxID=137443 RepID=A0A109QIH6_9ALPH|nr:nuclear protein [Macropodid alphaherpesvirus 1]AMB17050.1 nuclear protein [Macropodid alphaherpesvirus 1]
MGVVGRRQVLRAGVRSHTRFYRVFNEEVRKYNRTKIAGKFLKVLTVSVKTFSPDPPTHVRVIYEVDLKGRRPDCICICEFGPNTQIAGACFIVELKTCKFVSGTESASKREQKITGLAQLRDSLALIHTYIPPGTSPLYICPILVFVSQKTLKAFKVIRLPPKTIQGNVGGLARTLQGLSTYTVPSKPARCKKPRKHKHRCKFTRACGSRAPPPTPSSSASGGLLQTISALFG